MYTRSSSLHDDYPARVLLEAETRYASVLAQNRVRKLSILVNIHSSGWHSSRQNHDMHYTLRGYNREGWMVVMLEMKAGNAGDAVVIQCTSERVSLSILYISRCLDMDGIAIEIPVKDSLGVASSSQPLSISFFWASSAAAFASSSFWVMVERSAPVIRSFGLILGVNTSPFVFIAPSLASCILFTNRIL
ncbi:hypothetical protein IW261DRAFT_1424886 [Armillaria novae-zelandiae]|uniref:Uncharacterized protein n=1 Tax=Armillaria novae-zelandiae TaxID=153914 RepID=A0AA39NTX5_9AGAR|nr:hypothetical protein IW261DRAFT_1424886 [Armillaria novae-zelandiae]